VECADDFPKRYAFSLAGVRAGECFSPKFTVAVDVADEQLLGPLADKYMGKIDLCIDHHNSNQFYAKKTFMLPEAAAVAELVAAIVEEFPQCGADAADCRLHLHRHFNGYRMLLLFQHHRSYTHMVAAEMFKAGCNYAAIN
jgi:phosphoesterase RecJ-like protein